MVPDGDSVHALEPQPGVIPPVDETGQQGLGVAVRAETIARFGQFIAQFQVVIDLAVEYD
jgi:hypothetical protein